MRYIDPTRLRVPDGWLARAATAAAAVKNGADPEAHANVWRQLKDGLAELFYDKCWFCEVSVTRSFNAVDHFRPKGRVADTNPQHPGYRWLAFDRSNFRYSCTLCNSRRKDLRGGTQGGKADRFPLVDETKRVYVEGPTTDEEPELLDPCEIGDWQLLGCQRENGKPCAANDDPDDRKRAEASIKIYHLHHEPTCKIRHSKAVALLSDIEDAKTLFVATQSDASQGAAFKKLARRILAAVHEKSEFSGDMRFLLKGERDQAHPWIQELLET